MKHIINIAPVGNGHNSTVTEIQEDGTHTPSQRKRLTDEQVSAIVAIIKSED